MRILIVEDDPSIAETLEMILCGDLEGHCRSICKITYTIMEAMAVMEKWRPDYILVDILLEDGFGTKLIGVARDWFPDKPPIIIVISAMSGGESIAKKSGADFFVSKPFDVDILEQIIFKNKKNKIDGNHQMR